MNFPTHNVFNKDCPSRKVLEILSDKWTILIIERLARRTLRFGELKRSVGGISQKVLTHTLRVLERNGFVNRVSYPVLPLKVEYSLTDLGKSLSQVFVLITAWAESNIEAILEHRAIFEYDNRTLPEVTSQIYRE